MHSYFGAHAEHFSLGLEHLLVAQATAERLGRSIFRMPAPSSQRVAAAIERAIVCQEKSSSAESKKYQFDIALSFAGSERRIAEEIALRMKGEGFAGDIDRLHFESVPLCVFDQGFTHIPRGAKSPSPFQLTVSPKDEG